MSAKSTLSALVQHPPTTTTGGPEGRRAGRPTDMAYQAAPPDSAQRPDMAGRRAGNKPPEGRSQKSARSAAWPAGILAAALLSGCAAGGGQLPGPEPTNITVRMERGLAVARRECASCHAIERTGESPSPMAPPFRKLAAGLSERSLETLLLKTSEQGHYEMRPAGLGAADIRDIAAYIDGLD